MSASSINKIRKKLSYGFRKYILCKGNKVKYLRSQGVRIGQGCEILNKDSNYGSEPWLIEIGNNVTITARVQFLCHDASSRLFRADLPVGSKKFGNRFGAIQIEDNCFIGFGSVILPDVTIGPNSIVGAGSVVTKNVPPNTVFAGIPAKRICSLSEYIEKYREKMVPIEAVSREGLREELTNYFWGEYR